jgi:membrane protease YdiL (CAAX protease family)
VTYPNVAPTVAGTPYRGATDAATDAWWRGVPLRLPSWGVPDFFIAVGAWLVFSVVSSVPILMAADGTAAYAWALLVGVLLPWLGLGGWPWLVSRLRGNGWVLDYGLRVRAADIGWGLIYGVAALVVGSVLAALSALLFGEFDSAAGQLAEDLGDFPVQRLLFALAVGIGAPIFEEICYRGLLMTGLLKRGMSRWAAVLVSAALFAAMHLEPVRLALLFGVGLVLGLARVHRNNTTTPVVAHMTNNLPGAIGILFLLG